MLVSEILAIKGKVLFTVSSNRTLSEAVAVMTEQDVGSLVVFDKGRMTGLLTFREVLVATQKAGADWQSLPVEEAIGKDGPTLPQHPGEILLQHRDALVIDQPRQPPG